MRIMKPKNIGFVGLGRIGRPMATNILKSGLKLMVYDLRKEPMLELEKLGAKSAHSLAQLGEENDTIIVMVLDYKQIQEVAFSAAGITNGMKKNSTLIIMSTISPLEAKEAAIITAKKGINMLDAPVSGGIPGAESGTLTIMVGGEDHILRDNESLLKSMGENVYHMGAVGMGQTMKMIVQILVENNIVATIEAMAMAEKLGINLSSVFDIVTRSVGDSEVFRRWAKRIINRDFTPVGCIDIAVKDTEIITNTATALGVPLPLSNVTHKVMKDAQRRGLGHLHHASIIGMYEEDGHIEGYA